MGKESRWKEILATPHIEKHFTATNTVRDIVIGMSDGFTVPCAVAAGAAFVIARLIG